MPTYGYQVLGRTGSTLQVCADGSPVRRHIGITLDWSTVSAVSGSDATYGDGTVVAVGKKGLPFGTILTQITQVETQTVTLANATGGTFTLTFDGQTTAANAYNISAAALQAALEALSTIGAGNVSVSGSAGGPYTITFIGALAGQNLAQMTANGASLTGSSPTVTVATTVQGSTSYGKWGPYDSAATDGRATLARNRVLILNTTVLEQGAAGLVAVSSDHPDVIEGGACWKARIKAGSTGQPSWSNLEAALPLLRYVE